MDICDAGETDLVESPQSVGVVTDVPSTFRYVRVFEDGFESLAVVCCRGEGGFSEDGNVDESHHLLGVNEKSDEGDGPMSAEGIAFEI